jgi:DNA-binding LytR/AlgR family response regulator
MSLNCIIIDDEPSGRKIIEEYISETSFLKLCCKTESPLKAYDLIVEHAIDLIFLDIQMPKINGIDFLKSLSKPPLVIITTAYSEYALQGFELDVIDYLLKPISLERFLKATNKARDYFELQNTNEKPKNYFFIKSNNKFEKVLFHELLYVEAANNYIIIQTQEKRLITYLTFKGIEEILPSSLFIKVHKSYIVSLSKIDSLNNEEIRIGKHFIPISRSLKDEVMELVVNKNLVKR